MSKLDTTLKITVIAFGETLVVEYVLEQGPESICVIIEDVLKSNVSVFDFMGAVANRSGSARGSEIVWDRLQVIVESALVARGELQYDIDGNFYSPESID